MKYIKFDGDYYFLEVKDDGLWRWASPGGRRLLLTLHRSKKITSDDWFEGYSPTVDHCAHTASYGWTILADDHEEFPDWDDHSS
jgi:hypothetical protein